MKPITKPEPINNIPKKVIIAPTVGLQRSLKREFKCDSSHERFIAGTIPFCQRDDIGVLGPCVGAPATIMATEILLASGCEEIILFSVCGSLSKELKVGDIIFPNGAVSEDGTSKLYGAGLTIKHDPNDKYKDLKNSITTKLTSHEEMIWTTDAPYLETKEKLIQFGALGAKAVDMEYAALLQLSIVKDFNFSAVFIISDILDDEWEKGFSSAEFKNPLSIVSKALVNLLQ